tara:strand:+ start:202 stop:594 length:393 start_codon:yes stop_codon:yes gene_type:complete
MAGILDIINANVNYTKSGKQDINDTPFNIDKETLNAIINLNIPMSEKINMIASFERNKIRDQIGYGDQEVFVGEGGNRKRIIGAEYNPNGEGFSGYVMKDVDSGDTEGRIDFKKTMNFNKMLNNFLKKNR